VRYLVNLLLSIEVGGPVSGEQVIIVVLGEGVQQLIDLQKLTEGSYTESFAAK